MPFSNLLVWAPFFGPGYVLLSQSTLLESVESVVHESVCVLDCKVNGHPKPLSIIERLFVKYQCVHVL